MSFSYNFYPSSGLVNTSISTGSNTSSKTHSPELKTISKPAKKSRKSKTSKEQTVPVLNTSQPQATYDWMKIRRNPPKTGK